MYRIWGRNIPEAWEEFRWTFLNVAVAEQSRNGQVWTVPEVSLLDVDRPEQRVLFCDDRDANPFFHVMEFVWMMSGWSDVTWLAQFNKQMLEYSDDGMTLPQSYGYRWRTHWGRDQVAWVIEHLKNDPKSRRAVISMWDPMVDWQNSKDRPCNTTIYFRIVNWKLNMLVCNRSNDAVWGMFGANCVHMTFLQELIARSIGVEVGSYSVVTMNLHVYNHHQSLIAQKPGGTQNYYKTMDLRSYPLLQGGESYQMFIEDCLEFVDGSWSGLSTNWVREVAAPIYLAYVDKAARAKYIANIPAQDWRVACTRWMERKDERTHHS